MIQKLAEILIGTAWAIALLLFFGGWLLAIINALH